MRFRKTPDDRAIALIMAVAIMAVLAVVGFGFASSMRIQGAATSAIRDLAQARLAARAAFELFKGSLITDATAAVGSKKGPLSDHFKEDLYSPGIPETQQELLKVGDLTVRAELGTQPFYSTAGATTVKVRDESSKMNLNAFGNLSEWYADNFPNNKTAADVTDASQSVYHGVSQRFSSFEVSFEEFFYYYYKKGELWNDTWPEALRLTYDDGDPNTADSKEARIRCANLARAICLHRYGDDGKPGRKDVDDDNDDDKLKADGIDNDGDGVIDELNEGGVPGRNEGVDEPDEYNPIDPDGDGNVATSTGSKDDRAFTTVLEFKDIIQQYTWTVQSSTVHGGVYYAGADGTARAAEALRIYNLVRNELTVHSYTLDIRSACIDHPGHDGYDNDGDGLVDEDASLDGDGARTLTQLKTQINAGKTVYGTYDPATGTFTDRIDICERGFESSNEGRAAQAAYLYLKLKEVVTRFTLKNALDIVDYRDTDNVPTYIAQADVNLITGGNINEDLWGMEGLHVTEVGKYINVGAAFGSEAAPWVGAAGTCTYTVDAGHTTEAMRTSVISITDGTNLKPGDYLIKFQVQLPANGNGKLIVKNTDGSLDKEIKQSGTTYFGPLTVDATGKGSIKVFATHLDVKTLPDIVGQTFSVSDFHVMLPYIEVMNWSRRDFDITTLYLYIGTKALADIEDADVVELNAGNITNTTNPPAYKAGVTAALDNYIPGQRAMAAGFTTTHGGGYGFLVIAYDRESFERTFSGGDNNGTWGNHSAEDFPIWTVSTGGAGSGSEYMSKGTNPFYEAFDGLQPVMLLYRKAVNEYGLVGGGTVDGFQANGTALTLSATNLAIDRYFFFGNPWYSKSLLAAYDGWTRDYDGAQSRTSPGRWNRVSDAYSNGWWVYDAPAVFQNNDNGRHDLPTISDRGYYTSSAEVAQVSAGEHKNATFTYTPGGGTHDNLFPDWNQLIAYTVAGRTPARVNINTASAPVIHAAAVNLTPDADTLIGIRDFQTIDKAQVLCEAGNVKNVYYDDTPLDDDDGDNAVRDYAEIKLWLVKNASIFCFRGHAFSTSCSGTVRNASGNLRAIYGLQALFDRGRAVQKSGTTYIPVVSAVVRSPAD